MDAIERLPTVQLDESAAAAGLSLSTEAHWNQNEADWRYFLAKGLVFGIREHDRLIATAALLPYTAREAWISMVLVTEGRRRRGLATRLVDACLAAAKRRALTVWLDATPAGTAVYGPLGFTPTLQLRRLRLEHAGSANAGTALVQGELAELITRDTSALGFDRRELLAELSGRPGSRLVSTREAMALVRDGRAARHVGPVFADNAASAFALVSGLLARESGPHLIDAVADQTAFIESLTQAGWTIERPFQRMRFGPAPSQVLELPFAVVGPEFG